MHEFLNAIWADRRLPDRPMAMHMVTALAQVLAGMFRDYPGLLGNIDGLLKEAR